MNNSTEKPIAFLRVLLVPIIFTLIITASCHDNNKSDTKGLIPEKAFISILTDSYMANGLLSLPEIMEKYSKKDSVTNYIDIIRSHGYSYEEMNRTVKYYFVNKPKQLIKIYDNILEKLSEMESLIIKEQEAVRSAEDEKTKNMSRFLLPDPKMTRDPSFSYNIIAPGTFTLSFSVTLFPDDLSNNTCFSSWYCSADSSLNGRRTYLPSINYLKDGWPHIYTVTGRINSNGAKLLQGLYYDYENHPSDCEKHAEIIYNSFLFTRDPALL